MLISILGSIALATPCSLYQVTHAGGGDCTTVDDYQNDDAYGNPPTAAFAGSGNLTLEWLPDDESLRCIDGSRPAFHVSLVPESREWVFFNVGGGACGVSQVFDDNGTPGDPSDDTYQFGASAWENCSTSYLTEAGEMSTQNIKNWVQGKGVTADASNPFASVNLVEIDKCSFDRFSGDNEVVDVVGGEDRILYFHGRRIVKAVLQQLVSEGHLVGTEAEPAQVLFAGNSGGAEGLIFTVDEYSRYLQDDLELPVETAVLLDGRMSPMVENGVEHDAAPARAGFDLFDGIRAGNLAWPLHSTAPTGMQLGYRPLTYRSDGRTRVFLETMFGTSAAALDASCVAAHPTDLSFCYDPGHVLANHIETRRFVSHSLQDKNQLNNPIEHVQIHVPGQTWLGGHSWQDLCGASESVQAGWTRSYDAAAQCTETDGTEVRECKCSALYTEQATAQAEAMWGAGSADFALWSRDDRQHVQIHNDDYWNAELCIAGTATPVVMGDAVRAWFTTSTGARYEACP